MRIALTDIIADPAKMLNADYDPFAPLAATVPAYAAYLRQLESATALAIDGATRVASISAVRKEIYSPSDATNANSTANALEQIKTFAEGMLNTLTNGNASRYVTGGEYSTGGVREHRPQHQPVRIVLWRAQVLRRPVPLRKL